MHFLIALKRAHLGDRALPRSVARRRCGRPCGRTTRASWTFFWRTVRAHGRAGIFCLRLGGERAGSRERP